MTGRTEHAVRQRVRSDAWPDNPSSVALAGVAMKIARHLDVLRDSGADLGPWPGRLRHTLTHLALCGPAEGKLDPIYASLAAKQSPDFVPRPDQACCPDGNHERHRRSAAAS